MKMKLLGSGRAIKALSLLLVSYFYVLSGSSTVSISCNYYNGDGELSEDISVENAGFEGTVIILPYEMEGFSIFSEGKGQTADVHRHSKLSHKISATNMVTTNELQVDLKSLNARYSWVNKGTVSPDQADLSCAFQGTIKPGDAGGESELSEASSLLQATSLGKTITAESALRASPATTAVASVGWGLEAKLGTHESLLNQYTNIRSRPGYLTYPTSQQEGFITTGMTLEGQDEETGKPLFSKRYVPVPKDEEHPDGFGFPLSLGVMKVEDDSVYMENKLTMTMRWQEGDLENPGDGE